MRAIDRDLIRGGHYGQRSCEPHLKAEHMAAPTNAAKREESACQPGAVHTWHNCEVSTRSEIVCLPGIVLQNSQNAGRLISRGKTKQATIADRCNLKRTTEIACEFGARRRGPPT